MASPASTSNTLPLSFPFLLIALSKQWTLTVSTFQMLQARPSLLL